MKKFLVFALMFGTLAVVVPSVEAKTAAEPSATSNAAQDWRYRNRNRRINNRRVRRTVTTTRTRWVGRQRFRETVRITYLPNGRTRTQVIRRVRIR